MDVLNFDEGSEALTLRSTRYAFVQKVNSIFGEYEFSGVYSAPYSGYLLEGRTTTSDRMTLASCAAYCGGSVYFALEYGKPCLGSCALKTSNLRRFIPRSIISAWMI